MSTLDFNAELAAAGANVRSRWGAVRFFIRRYPLGAIGAVIMAIFVFAAAFSRRCITVYDPLTTNAAASLAQPGAAHWLGCDFMGRDVYSRIIYGARISLAVSMGSMLLGSLDRRHARAVLGLSPRLVRPHHPALSRDDAVAAASGDGDHHGGGARALAAQHDPRDRHPAGALCRARHPRQHAQLARAALCRGGEGDRHEREAHRAPPHSAQHAGAADRAGDRAARLDDPHRSPRCRSSASASPSRIRPGAGCCRNRRPNTCAPRRGW